MVRVVSPARVVYTISNEAAVSSLVDQLYPDVDRSWRHHFIGNLKQLCGFQHFGEGRATRAKAENWSRLEDVVWICLDGNDEYVPLLGTVTHMFESVMTLRADYNNTLEALRELLPSRSGSQKKTKVSWARGKRAGPFWRMVEPPSSIHLLADGSSLTEVNWRHPALNVGQQVCAQLA